MQSTASSMTSRVPVEGQMRDGTETVFDRVIRSATSGLLGTLYVLNKNQSTPWIVNVLAVTINYFQVRRLAVGAALFPTLRSPATPGSTARPDARISTLERRVISMEGCGRVETCAGVPGRCVSRLAMPLLRTLAPLDRH